MTSGYEALRDASAVIELDRDYVVTSGPEATTYLQGQLSQDVEGIEVGGSALTLLLEPQGKISAFARLTRTGADEYLFDTEAGHGAEIVARLRRFKLRTKVDIEAVEQWSCLAVRGPAAPEPTGVPAIDPIWDRSGSAVIAAFAWPGLRGVDLIGPDPVRPAGVAHADALEFEARRIECGLPVMGRDLDVRTIPEEAGIVASSVSFTKGCYTGQELVARIDSRGGNVPRRLHVLRAGDEQAEMTPGAELWIGDESAGRVTSAARHPAGGQVGLAYVKRSLVGASDGQVQVEAKSLHVSLELAPPASP